MSQPKIKTLFSYSLCISQLILISNSPLLEDGVDGVGDEYDKNTLFSILK